MSRRRVVVTGLGIVSPLGSTVATAWDGIVNGRSGIGLITKMDLAEACECDREAAHTAIREVRPGMTILEVSSKRGTGMAAWMTLLQERRAAWVAQRGAAAPA